MLIFKPITLALLLATAAPAFAQITYTDIDPDVTLTEWDAHFLQIGPEPGDGLYIWKHPNEVVVNSMTNTVQVLFDGTYPASVEYGQTIGSVGMWKQPNYAVLNHEGATGNWINVEDRYLGLRYKQAGEWHYAWARLDIDQAPSHFTLKDFAVEPAANTAISAGAIASADVASGHEPAMYSLCGHLLTLGREAIVSISSTLGEQLFEAHLHANESIDLSSLAGGCVFIRVSSVAKTANLKVIIGD